MSTTTTTIETVPSSTASSNSHPLLTSLRQNGFIHIPNFLSESELTTLRAASAHATKLARTGSWPHIRTVPKQFPPWPNTPPPDTEGGIWGVQHLLHPDMPGRSTFASLYFKPELLSIVSELLSIPASSSASDILVMELFNLLVSPSGNVDFELRWHRDAIPLTPEMSAEEELKELYEKSPPEGQSHAQYNIALYPDSSLIVVPGSHRRARTEVEKMADPFEAELPDMITVHMQPGDAVFYDNNILHRGVYTGIDTGDQKQLGRFTLHGSVGKVDGKEQSARARNVLQHGVGAWVGREDAAFGSLGGETGVVAEKMRERLVSMGGSWDGGFALEG